MGSIREIFEALQADIATEVARPENADGSGGTSFAVEVLVGDEYVGKFQAMGSGRVVLAVGDGQFGGPKSLNGRLRTLCTWTPALEAHLWVPGGAVGERNSLTGYDNIESLVKCVTRAIYAGNHGAQLPVAAPVDRIEMIRDEKILRHGQAAMLTYSVAIPITEGCTLTTLPPGARINIRTRVNPE